MNRDLHIIITAGGMGTRMGGDIVKQFIELDGKPILLRTIEMFLKWQNNLNIILVLPKIYHDYWKNYCLENDIWIKHILVSGGVSRFHSVKNALEYVPDDSIVAVHDGVRPFVSTETMNALFDYPFNPDKGIVGVIPIMPSIESMRKRVLNQEGELIRTETVNRDDYISVQTPQVFLSRYLKESYKKPYSPHFTDDASVVESSGYIVETTLGSRFNVKITTPEDLLFAELILKMNLVK